MRVDYFRLVYSDKRIPKGKGKMEVESETNYKKLLTMIQQLHQGNEEIKKEITSLKYEGDRLKQALESRNGREELRG